MRINTGEVDLVTPTWTSPNSKAAVSVEDATVKVQQNSRASVKNDPKRTSTRSWCRAASAEVRRGAEKIELTQWEKVSFPSGGQRIEVERVGAAGTGIAIELGAGDSENPKTEQIQFEWQPVDDAVAYTLRISPTTMFTKLVKEVKSNGTSAEDGRVGSRRLFLERVGIGRQEAEQRSQRNIQVLSGATGRRRKR